MPMHLPDDARDAALDALVALPDAGSGTGSVELRTGSQPEPGGEATGTLLATFTLPATTFGAASGGTATANAIDATTGVDDGEVGWFRVLDSDGNICWDGAADDPGITFNTKVISTGVDVKITSWTVTLPDGSSS